MAAGFPGAIAEAMMCGPEGGKDGYAAMSIAGIDPRFSGTNLILPERTFQYWPESITDTIDVGWNFKDVAGASHALAQWGSNQGRTITFELQMHRFMKPERDRTPFDKILDPFGLNKPDSELPKNNRPYNVDIETEIRYLRAFCYPVKADKEVMILPPPIAILAAPGVGLNETGGDAIFAVMTGCDVIYNLLFPNGVPRRATVSLTFRQVVQELEGVFWKTQNETYKWRNIANAENLESKGGDRILNKLGVDSVE